MLPRESLGVRVRAVKICCEIFVEKRPALACTVRKGWYGVTSITERLAWRATFRSMIALSSRRVELLIFVLRNIRNAVAANVKLYFYLILEITLNSTQTFERLRAGGTPTPFQSKLQALVLTVRVSHQFCWKKYNLLTIRYPPI